MLAAAALRAFYHVAPESEAPQSLHDLATVGALLRNEEIANTRGMVDKPMSIQFLGPGPRVVPWKLETADSRSKK